MSLYISFQILSLIIIHRTVNAVSMPSLSILLKI